MDKIVKTGLKLFFIYIRVNSKSALFAYLDRYLKKESGFICFENLEVVFSNAQIRT